MKYYVWREQQGEGCDYTIGCGLSVEKLHATTREEAIEEVLDLPEDWQEEASQRKNPEDYLDYLMHDGGLAEVNGQDDRTMSRISILAVEDEIDMLPILQAKLAEVKAFRAKLQERQKETAERAEYKRLQKKFGK